MEFDKSRIYSALNAEDVKVGSKGYFARTIANLRVAVEIGLFLETVTDIRDDRYESRFCDNKGGFNNFFYLVDEPEGVKLRPYKDTKEMVDDFCERFNLLKQSYKLPTMWVQSKIDVDIKYIIMRLTKSTVTMCFGFDFGYIIIDLESLAKEYTWLDGSPCGIKE